MLKHSILVACCLLIGCGNGGTESSTQSQSQSSSQSKRATFRTANTHLAGLEDCYKREDEAICLMELQIAKLTNERRAEQGLAPLLFHAGWNFAAQMWSKEQSKAEEISHVGFPDQRIETYEKEFGNDGEPQLGGENVGEIKMPGKTTLETAAILNQGWFDSAGHRKNMLGSDFKYIGVGLHKSSSGIFYATQLFARDSEP